jgi:glycosyltransferase involved in cell wall biosynthesis
MRILRVYHAGRDSVQRAREQALIAAGAEVTLVVPDVWDKPDANVAARREGLRLVELPVRRSGDVNRHRYHRSAIQRLLDEIDPHVLDLHEEAYSAAAHQWLSAASTDLPVVMYAAQNIDKRYPPPFCCYERRSYERVSGFYPCSRQAAAVARGKGFRGAIEVLPLGYDDDIFWPGTLGAPTDEIVLLLAGRLIPEKGITDAIRTLARVQQGSAARLVVCGAGPEEPRARELAASLGVAAHVDFQGWQSSAALAVAYREAHVVLVPSWPSSVAEQFGRVIVEAQASGAVVVGYSCGAISEVVGDAGMIVPLGDRDSLADCVMRLVKDPEQFDRLRAAGLRQSVERTWRVVARRQVALYREVYERRNAAPAVMARSPRAQRTQALAEFGPTAWTPAGVRPFALAPLDRGGRGVRWLGTAIDCGAELIAAAGTVAIRVRRRTHR